MEPKRAFLTGLLVSAAVVVLLASCPIPFGYYSAGNEFLTNLETDGSASPVGTPVFAAAPATGGGSSLVSGNPIKDQDQLIALQCATRGALIYYTTSTGATLPPDPDPYIPATRRYSATSPIVVSGNGTVVHIKAIAFKPLMLPSAIASLTVTVRYNAAPDVTWVVAGSDCILIAWNPVSDAVSYNLYYSEGVSVSPTNAVVIPAATSPRTLSGLQPGTTYSLVVTSVGTAGESAPSPTHSAVPYGVDGTGFVVRPASDTALYAEWALLANAQYYAIDTDISAAGSFATEVYSGSGTPVPTDAGRLYCYVGSLQPGTIYYFRLTPYYSAGNAAPSSIVVAAATFPSTDKPLLQNIPTGSYAPPSDPPLGGTSTGPWQRTATPLVNAWVQGPWTYLLWDQYGDPSQAFAITAYDSTGTLVGEWIDVTNSYISNIVLDPVTWILTFEGQSGATELPWRDLML